MKLQCDVCEKEEAEVLCCADEAVLCKMCDSKVHAANMLSRKHHRLLLLNHLGSASSSSSSLSSFSSSSSSSSSSLTSSSSHLPLCDICKVTKAHVFCLEDRALLCRNCDVSTHAARTYSAAHQRFLISGIRVALQSSAESSTSDIVGSSSSDHPGFPMAPRTIMPMNPSTAETSSMHLADEPAGFPPETDWPFDEHFCYTDDDLAFYDFSDASCRFSDR